MSAIASLKTVLASMTLGIVSVSMQAADIKLELRADRTHYKVGETIRFKIVYRNISTRPVRLLAQTESYPVDVFSIREVPFGRKPEKLRLGEQSIDFAGLSKEVVMLSPGRSVTRSISVDVRQSLPPIYGDTRGGLFLIFPASAVRLWSSGNYEVSANFHSSINHPVSSYLPKGAKLWAGDVRSGPITIQISSK